MLAPGHSPGHTVYTHTSSAVLLAGDAISLMRPTLSLGAAAAQQDNRVGVRLGGWAVGEWIPAVNRQNGQLSVPQTAKLFDPAASCPPPLTPSHQVAFSFKPPPPLPSIALRAEPFVFCFLPVCKEEEAQRTACQLLGRTLQYRLLVAGHDAAVEGVWSREQAHEWAVAAPECQQFV